MDKDWPLEIMDNNGMYHYVTMKPGEMLFYESAKALHGRPAPLQGDGYSNVFIHFKPTTEGVWDYGWY
jgi:prolyl 4-hydroxylase